MDTSPVLISKQTEQAVATTAQSNVELPQDLEFQPRSDMERAMSDDSVEQHVDGIPKDEQAFLQYQDINYFVPVNKPREEKALPLTASLLSDKGNYQKVKINEHTGVPEPVVKKVSGRKGYYKQVLHEVNGYVKPKEMVAIMGPSGSGKTSLLNVLAQRIGLSGGSFVDGKVTVNGRKLKQQDYGKIGAFVQQDDVLVETMTPRELLKFAARIRTSLSNMEIEDLVDRVVERLGLTKCQHTVVGGWLRKGLSGGERKRVSIGYELITEPSLLMLDEPTSGLDSSTSAKIMARMKTEAERGMTVLATIHQPQSKIFFMFDRVILLSEGYCVYNGSPKDVRGYFSQFGLQIGQYSNPADKLSHVGAQPRSCMNKDVSILTLADASAVQQRANMKLEPSVQQRISSRLSNKFTVIAEQREVGFFRQIALIYKRNMLNSIRNPLSLMAVLVISFVQAFLMVSLYKGVCGESFVLRNIKTNSALVQDQVGLSFLITSDQYTIVAFGMVLLIPSAQPVYSREVKSRMYSPTAYYFASTLSSITVYCMYPILVSALTFYPLDFTEGSITDMLQWMSIMIMMALVGLTVGQFIGTVIYTSEIALQILTQSMTLIWLGAGLLANTADTSNILILFLTYTSPLRYGCELSMRRILAGKKQENVVLNSFGYTFGVTTCYSALAALSGFFFITGWIILVRKAKK